MKNRIAFFAGIIFMFAFISSCTQDEEKDYAFNYIDLEFYEHFSSDNSFINFTLQTVETFPCNNFSLEVNVEPTSVHTDIQIMDIDVPDVCITTLGPATQQVELGPAEDITPGFTLWVNDKRHDFAVVVQDHLITIEEKTPFENHLFFTFDSLMRIPENTVWGYVVFGQNEENKNNIMDEIMEAFKEEGAEELLLQDGFYYYFTAKNNEIYFENLKQEIQTFHFKFDKPLEVLTKTFNRIMGEYDQSDIQLRLFNTRGERYIM